MKLGDLYGIVLTFVLVGMVLGVGILVMQNFQDASGVTGTEAAVAINSTQAAVSSLGTTWMAVIVIIVAAAIILGLVINSFRGQ